MNCIKFLELFLGTFIAVCVLYFICSVIDWFLRRFFDEKNTRK